MCRLRLVVVYVYAHDFAHFMLSERFVGFVCVYIFEVLTQNDSIFRGYIVADLGRSCIVGRDERLEA